MIHGVNHIAIAVADMRRTLRFYCGMLGLRLVGLFPMHGVPGAVHAFCDMGDGRLLSFIRFGEPVPAAPGVSAPRSPAGRAASGAMHHVALHVPDERTLAAVRERVVAAGHTVSAPVDHGFCRSIYLAGPDGEQLEVSTLLRPLDDREIDVASATAVGIDADELQAMREGR